MAGLYVHIPFCRRACHYCDFHFSTQLGGMSELMAAIEAEARLRAGELEGTPLHTIYLGGGTPSLLSIKDLSSIFRTFGQVFLLDSVHEITLEANPEDVTPGRLRQWRDLGINRLSVGIQTFHEATLTSLNRAHNSGQAHRALELLSKSDYPTWTADLMFALPSTTEGHWQADLSNLLAYEPSHLSVYGLTIEEKTALGKWQAQGKFEAASETRYADEFLAIRGALQAAGYEHYEISNYAKPRHRAQHNSGYWNAMDCLGLGPGAHGTIGAVRSINPSNNAFYLKALSSGQLPTEREALSPRDRANEWLLTRLRTAEGLDLVHFSAHFGLNLREHHGPAIGTLVAEDLLVDESQHLRLSESGLLVADSIIETLWLDSVSF